MSIRFAINGLGRMGRALLRVARQREDLELAAINDIAPAAELAPLVARDTLHGPLGAEVRAAGDSLEIDGRTIPVTNEARLEEISWGADVPIAVDATGHCLTREAAQRHLRGSVEKVLVSGNAEGMDATICWGVNHRHYDPTRHQMLSAASCTTNCLAPVAWILDREFGLERALLNTVHSYNNDQRLLEYPHRDPRRARAATLNLIPTTTSATQAIGRVLPGLAGRIEGFAVRVPTPNVSLIDLVVELAARPSSAEVNGAFRQAAIDGEFGRILAVTEEELVSTDFMGDPHSAIVDLPLTQTVDNRLLRVVAWYDNEWGHASRLADLVEMLGGAEPGS